MQLSLEQILTAGVAIAALITFFIARQKDAEANGALKQRILTLEQRADHHDNNYEKLIQKFDDLSREIRDFFQNHLKDHQ